MGHLINPIQFRLGYSLFYNRNWPALNQAQYMLCYGMQKDFYDYFRALFNLRIKLILKRKNKRRKYFTKVRHPRLIFSTCNVNFFGFNLHRVLVDVNIFDLKFESKWDSLFEHKKFKKFLFRFGKIFRTAKILRKPTFFINIKKETIKKFFIILNKQYHKVNGTLISQTTKWVKSYLAKVYQKFFAFFNDSSFLVNKRKTLRKAKQYIKKRSSKEHVFITLKYKKIQKKKFIKKWSKIFFLLSPFSVRASAKFFKTKNNKQISKIKKALLVRKKYLFNFTDIFDIYYKLITHKFAKKVRKRDLNRFNSLVEGPKTIDYVQSIRKDLKFSLFRLSLYKPIINLIPLEDKIRLYKAQAHYYLKYIVLKKTELPVAHYLKLLPVSTLEKRMRTKFNSFRPIIYKIQKRINHQLLTKNQFKDAGAYKGLKIFIANVKILFSLLKKHNYKVSSLMDGFISPQFLYPNINFSVAQDNIWYINFFKYLISELTINYKAKNIVNKKLLKYINDYFHIRVYIFDKPKEKNFVKNLNKKFNQRITTRENKAPQNVKKIGLILNDRIKPLNPISENKAPQNVKKIGLILNNRIKPLDPISENKTPQNNKKIGLILNNEIKPLNPIRENKVPKTLNLKKISLKLTNVSIIKKKVITKIIKEKKLSKLEILEKNLRRISPTHCFYHKYLNIVENYKFKLKNPDLFKKTEKLVPNTEKKKDYSYRKFLYKNNHLKFQFKKKRFDKYKFKRPYKPKVFFKPKVFLKLMKNWNYSSFAYKNLLKNWVIYEGNYWVAELITHVLSRTHQTNKRLKKNLWKTLLLKPIFRGKLKLRKNKQKLINGLLTTISPFAFKIKELIWNRVFNKQHYFKNKLYLYNKINNIDFNAVYPELGLTKKHSPKIEEFIRGSVLPIPKYGEKTMKDPAFNQTSLYKHFESPTILSNLDPVITERRALRDYHYALDPFFQKYMKLKQIKSLQVNIGVDIGDQKIITAKFISFWLKSLFRKGKKLTYVLKTLDRFIRPGNNYIGAVSVLFAGRFTRSAYTTYKYYRFGRLNNGEIFKQMDYHGIEFLTKFGMCGIKVKLQYKVKVYAHRDLATYIKTAVIGSEATSHKFDDNLHLPMLIKYGSKRLFRLNSNLKYKNNIPFYQFK